MENRNRENKINILIYLSSYEKVEVDTWKNNFKVT